MRVKLTLTRVQNYWQLAEPLFTCGTRVTVTVTVTNITFVPLLLQLFQLRPLFVQRSHMRLDQ